MLANWEWHLWSTVLSAVKKERFTLAQLAGPYYWNTEKKCALTVKPCRDNHTLHWHKLELNALKSDKRPKRLYFSSQRLYIILYYYKISHRYHILFNAFFLYLSEVSELTSYERWTKDPPWFLHFLFLLFNDLSKNLSSFFLSLLFKVVVDNLTSYEWWSNLGTLWGKVFRLL